ncbi:hypothetical protein ACFL27_21315 [candidate division CSSED10-310 bacterium]|uniref:Antitoxin n=1 Tax=candidate division CSSED10-310 bacterium TaxID=2855610 RepID=A0ABV6Z2T0_UNCC1
MSKTDELPLKMSLDDAYQSWTMMIQQVKQGHTVIITEQGQSIARLIPIAQKIEKLERADILAQLEVIRAESAEKAAIPSLDEDERKI